VQHQPPKQITYYDNGQKYCLPHFQPNWLSPTGGEDDGMDGWIGRKLAIKVLLKAAGEMFDSVHYIFEFTAGTIKIQNHINPTKFSSINRNGVKLR
jgi:hypothetical protein